MTCLQQLPPAGSRVQTSISLPSMYHKRSEETCKIATDSRAGQAWSETASVVLQQKEVLLCLPMKVQPTWLLAGSRWKGAGSKDVVGKYSDKRRGRRNSSHCYATPVSILYMCLTLTVLQRRASRHASAPKEVLCARGPAIYFEVLPCGKGEKEKPAISEIRTHATKL